MSGNDAPGLIKHLVSLLRLRLVIPESRLLVDYIMGADLRDTLEPCRNDLVSRRIDSNWIFPPKRTVIASVPEELIDVESLWYYVQAIGQIFATQYRVNKPCSSAFNSHIT